MKLSKSRHSRSEYIVTTINGSEAQAVSRCYRAWPRAKTNSPLLFDVTAQRSFICVPLASLLGLRLSGALLYWRLSGGVRRGLFGFHAWYRAPRPPRPPLPSGGKNVGVGGCLSGTGRGIEEGSLVGFSTGAKVMSGKREKEEKGRTAAATKPTEKRRKKEKSRNMFFIVSLETGPGECPWWR